MKKGNYSQWIETSQGWEKHKVEVVQENPSWSHQEWELVDSFQFLNIGTAFEWYSVSCLENSNSMLTKHKKRGFGMRHSKFWVSDWILKTTWNKLMSLSLSFPMKSALAPLSRRHSTNSWFFFLILFQSNVWFWSSSASISGHQQRTKFNNVQKKWNRK
jgi:hypothetical protein